MPPTKDQPLTTPAPLTEPAPSEVGRKTSVRKLNGVFYTPMAVADRIVAGADWPANGGRLIDPACGDGIFLEAAMRKLGRSPGDATIEGWDIDGPAVEAARARVAAVARSLGWSEPPTVRHVDALDAHDTGFACVVGNPPYLESKRMPRDLKERIRSRFPLAAKGAFDLYGAFVELSHRLAPDGELHLLIPNRFLCVRYARELRRELLSKRRIEVHDLSRDDVFSDASVYPIILRGLPGSVAQSQELAGVIPVMPEDPAGRRLLERVLGAGLPAMDQQARGHWTVSFHRAGLRDRYVFAERPDSPHARPFLGGARWSGNREVDGGEVRWAGAWIDYDVERARRDRNGLPPAELFAPPTLVLCQNARRGRAAVDLQGRVLKDTFLAFKAHEATGAEAEATLRWLQEVLHSDVFHYLYEHIYAGTRKSAGYLHFLPSYLAPFPMPERPSEGETRGEAAVRKAYGVLPDEARALDAYEFPDP